MKASNFNLTDYLQRIGFKGQVVVDALGLKELMLAQIYSVPFENLDVQGKKIVSMVPEDIVEKIVHRKRGGYCYEVNGLFAMALLELGIPYFFVAARPMFYPVRRPKTHLAIIATVEGKQWLCDLGFGSYGIKEPLCLDDTDKEIKQGHDIFKLSEVRKNEYLLEAKNEDSWQSQYSFELSAQEWIDFFPANYLNSTHPDSIFVQKLLVILHHPLGRKILKGNSIKYITNEKIFTLDLEEHSIVKVLENEFGLHYPTNTPSNGEVRFVWRTRPRPRHIR
jgi:N-hydroxyarylamine O-acetyltransferase